MIDPLAAPPFRSHAIEARESDEPPPSVRTPATRIAAFSEELGAFVSLLDARRLAWEATRYFPSFTFPLTRARLLSLVGCHISPGTAVCGYVHIVGPRDCAGRFRVGTGCIIGPDVTVCLDAPVTLGSGVSIGPRAVLYTATHALGIASRRMELNVMARPIVIEDGAWVGMAALVLSGVRIGRGAVVASGAVVNEDVPDNVLVAGNPARVVENLPPR